MEKNLRKMTRNTFILMIISIFLGSTLKVNADPNEVFRVKLYYSTAIFINLIPIVYFLKKFRTAKKYPIFFIGFVLYYLIISPIWMTLFFGDWEINTLNLSRESLRSLSWILGSSGVLLLISQVFIIKYVFIDIITGRRKAKTSDIGIVLLTYITLGIIFGFSYVILLKMDNQAISGIITGSEHRSIEVYLRSIYFSFITLTSVGYGEILPQSMMAQQLVILESVMGVLLLSFSLGIVFSSNLNAEETQEETDDYMRLKKKLMRDFEKILDDNLREEFSKTEENEDEKSDSGT
jgi:voltage-gated potassium channel Kch